MPADRRLAPCARLPSAYRGRDVLHSTVDAFGRAHWLLRGPDERYDDDLYDALVVTVDNADAYATRLGPVRARVPRIDALPDGGFVVADARSRRGVDQVRVFDALGRPVSAFTVGDAIEHLLTDERGDLWVGYFDEGVFGDPLSAAGVRRWSSTGDPLWRHTPLSDAEFVSDCYALNVGRRATWVYPYTLFPLLEVREGRPVRVRTTPVRGATGVVVCGGRVAFRGGYRAAADQLVLGELTETAVEFVAKDRLVRPDGAPLGRCRTVCRGPRLYVLEEPFTQWTVFELG
jgi:hypothetical protein